MDFKNKISKLSNAGLVLTFLALEVFAFIAFSFGNSFLLFGILSFCLATLSIVMTLKELTKDGFTKFAYFLFPLLLFVVLTALGVYTKAHIYTSDFSLAEAIFVLVGLMSIAVCGYTLSLNKTFKIRTFLIVIYSALALLVLINFFSNIVNFGFFYTVKYSDYYMYYAGSRSEVPVSKLAYILEGFRFIEVNMEYYLLFPFLLLSSSFFAINLNPKKETKMFVLFIVFTFIGLISVVFMPSLIGLLGILAVAIIDALIFIYNKFPAIRKAYKIALYVVLGFAIVLFLIMAVNNQSIFQSISSVIENNHFLDRLLNTNRFVSPYNKNLTDIFCSNRFLGFYYHTLASSVLDEAHLTGSWFFDNFMTSGVIGNICFIVMLVMGFKAFKKYKCDDNELINKETLLAFVLVFIIYTFRYYNGEYAIFYSVVKPIYMTAPFMLVIFMLAYIYGKSIQEEKKDEKEKL